MYFKWKFPVLAFSVFDITYIRITDVSIWKNLPYKKIWPNFLKIWRNFEKDLTKLWKHFDEIVIKSDKILKKFDKIKKLTK